MQCIKKTALDIQNKDSQVITVLGPTATGKTRLAVELARRLHGEIISADSRQVYRGMDLGTGKDLAEYDVEGQTVPYHLIDVAEPGEEYNVSKFQYAAYQAMKDIRERGHQVVLCGGSGMYIEALLKGYRLAPVPPLPELRKELEKKSDEELTRLLASYHPLHNHTDTCERARLLHAVELEIYYAAHPELEAASQAVPSVILGICGERNLIRSRITSRLKERLENGMIEEIEKLLENGVPTERLLKYGLEYRYITLYLQGRLSENEMFAKLNTAIHQFSKRQMTWFRKMERDGFEIHWLDVAWSLEEKMEKSLEIIARYGIS